MTCVIYTCHNVIPLAAGTEERGTLDLNTFLHQLSWLRRLGVRFIPMSDLRAWLLGSKKIPKRSAVLTFDDALISIADHVFPFLKQQAIPVTIFVIAGLIGCESRFSTHASAPLRRHLDLAQLELLIATGLVEIGAHGYHHLNFTRIAGLCFSSRGFFRLRMPSLHSMFSCSGTVSASNSSCVLSECISCR